MIRLSHLNFSLKTLVTCFVLALAVGYSVSLLQVYNRSSFNTEKTVLHFRGSESENQELYIPQSNTTMISVAHVHTFSQPVVLGMIGFIFAFTGLSERKKVFWITASFLGSFLMNISPWLIRDLSPHFIYLLSLSGAALFISFIVMTVAVLREVWQARGQEKIN